MISGSWIAYKRKEKVAHFTEHETRNGYYVCICGVTMWIDLVDENNKMRKCKNCAAKLKKLNQQSGNFEKLRTRFNF